MENEMKNLAELASQIKNVESNVTGMIVPLLKDTIADTNRHNKRLFILCLIALVVILITNLYSQFLVYKQNKEYAEFLSQFEFVTEDTSYIQDLDSTDGGDAIINSGITINQ